jgi:hypothetical protein
MMKHSAVFDPSLAKLARRQSWERFRRFVRTLGARLTQAFR